jgi:hypothetical protein
MKTSSITFGWHEVAVILPALEDLINGIVEACRRDRYPRRDTTHVPYRGQEVYRERRYDGGMAAHVLSCRNKLKFTGASREASLNSFELAAAALAFRVVRKEKLVSKDMLASPLVAGLECKLENARRCAKRLRSRRSGQLRMRKKLIAEVTSPSGCVITSSIIVLVAKSTKVSRSSIRKSARP